MNYGIVSLLYLENDSTLFFLVTAFVVPILFFFSKNHGTIFFCLHYCNLHFFNNSVSVDVNWHHGSTCKIGRVHLALKLTGVLHVGLGCQSMSKITALTKKCSFVIIWQHV